jgi:hypothetical protein
VPKKIKIQITDIYSTVWKIPSVIEKLFSQEGKYVNGNTLIHSILLQPEPPVEYNGHLDDFWKSVHK